MSSSASSYPIATILPASEAFTPNGAGAIALFVKETTINSAYHNHITVYGQQDAAQRRFSGARFQPVKPRMKMVFGNNGGYVRAIIQHLRANPPGLIETHNRVKTFHTLARAFPNTPISLYLHNDPFTIKGAQTPKERWEILSRAEAVYCCSDFVRRRFLTGLEAGHTDHVHVVYHGVETIKHSRKEPFILYAGRIIPEKGLLELAEAARQLLPHFPGWRLAIVGAERHGSKKISRYEDKVRKTLAPLEKQIVFLGHQPHKKVLELYGRASIAVVPSVWAEPLGRTAIEAMAAGCALVTSGHGGLAEVAGNTGVLVSPVSPQGLALALQGLMEDPETLRSIQQLCLERSTLFSLENSLQTLDHYRYQLMSRAYGG